MTINIVYDVKKNEIYSMYTSDGRLVPIKIRKYVEKKIISNPNTPGDWRIRRFGDYWVSTELTPSGRTSQEGLFRDYTFEC